MKKNVKATSYELSEDDIKDAIEFWIRDKHDEHYQFDYDVTISSIAKDGKPTQYIALATRLNEDE